MKTITLHLARHAAFIFLLLSAACSSSTPSDSDLSRSADSTLAVSPDSAPYVDGYHLVWEDNFSDSVLNNDSWNIEVNGNGSGNNELQFYRAENISIGTEPISGKQCLILTAKKENYGGRAATSGRLNSRGKQLFKFGRVEASIKLPSTANGLWPAFWMMGNDYDAVGWPACGEIDILEMGHGNGIAKGTQDRLFNGACHWGPSWNNGAYPNYAKEFTSTYSLQDNSFHLYTLVWDEEYIKMYLDQDKYPDVAPYFEMAVSDKSTETSSGNYFQKEFFIILNHAVGGNFPQIWDIANVTALSSGEAKMFIDFVRVYQKN